MSENRSDAKNLCGPACKDRLHVAASNFYAWFNRHYPEPSNHPGHEWNKLGMLLHEMQLIADRKALAEPSQQAPSTAAQELAFKAAGIPDTPTTRFMLAEAAMPDYKQFALAILKHAREYLGSDIDGGMVQDKATEFGLLEEWTAQEPCGEGCACVEVSDFPQICYRLTRAVSDDLSALAHKGAQGDKA